MNAKVILVCAFASSLLFSGVSIGTAAELSVLFLGDSGHHQPRARYLQIQPFLASRGVKATYTDKMADLNEANLARFDALLVYANIDRIEPLQEKALLDYVSQGGGFVPLHCASYCFRNSTQVVALMGAQFQRHGVGVFRTQLAQSNHPILQGFGGFESWDETYVHHMHNEMDRTVLAYRVDAQGREPWTWIRTQGKGRVFYTAWGHDQRTWGNPGFQNLLERGIRWAAGQDPQMAPSYLSDQAFPTPQMNSPRQDLKPFEYVNVGSKIPNYTPGKNWGTQGDALSKMQKPLAPTESLKHLIVPQGFRAELFAAEPEIGGKPIAMAWDERGRLWIAETYDYPNELQPPGKGRDCIRILEDSDGDGRADKFKVFADKLSIPTSLAFYRGGVLVQDGRQTLFLQDHDNDDVADQRTVVFSGWNQRDTHGGVSNFQYGLDNWVWAMQGYNSSQPTAPGAKQQPVRQGFRQGFFRFRPDGSEVEFIRSTNNNTWGLGVSEEGLIFGSTANRNPSVFMPIPNRYYERVKGWAPSLTLGGIADTHLFNPITKNIRQVDQHGGYTAAAGHALYTAREYPQPYWNRTAFVNGPTGHLVGTFVLKAKGSDFQSTSPFNLLASDDQWTAPIMSEVGPDGNVWVIDWYNYIVQHNPTPQGFKTGKGNAYETDLRDKKHGRIYRVAPVSEDGSRSKSFSLAGATPDELVDALGHPTMLWRKHAQRLLVERGKLDVVGNLIKRVEDESVDEIGLNVGAIHSLWTLHGLGAMRKEDSLASRAAMRALQHPSAGVRRNALQVLPSSAVSTKAVLSAGVLADPDAQVRLAAFLAMADLPPCPGAGDALLQSMKLPANRNDRWIPDAAISAAASHSGQFLQQLAGDESSQGERLMQSAAIVAEHFGRTGPVEKVADLAAALSAANADTADAIVAGLSRGWPAESKVALTPELEADLERVLKRLPPTSQGLLVKLAQRWGSQRFAKYAEEVAAAMLQQVDDIKLLPEKRLAAARQLVQFQPADEKVVASLLERVTPQTPPEMSSGLIRAIQGSAAEKSADLLVNRFAGLTPKSRAVGISVLLSRASSTTKLLDAVEEGRIQLVELSLAQKQALMAHPRLPLRRRARQLLSRGGALPSADRQKVLDELLPITRESGDASAGKLVFKKQCAKCHMHSGEGTRIGPDLTGMAVHPKAELLIHMIDPSRNVEGNFRVYSVVTTDGLILTGLLASESRTSIELFDAEGKKLVVLREDIEELKASPKSLMPDGIEKQVSRIELRDLLEFLTQRGKFLALDLSKAATISSDRGMFMNKNADVERLIFPDWTPKSFKGVPFQLIDPKQGAQENVILLHGPNGPVSSKMPKSARLPCNGPARAIHLLSGVSGWGHPYSREKTVSMVVRLVYADGQTEDHSLRNGVHFADYIRRVDVPQSELAFMLRGQQIRYLSVLPKRSQPIRHIDLLKGPDRTAPVVMAVTIEAP